MRFHDLDLNIDLMHAISDIGYQYCSPIQSEILPHTLRGKDAIGKAQTGTGKTAAFAIPMGAKVVEKHFTLDKTMEGPDHKVSLEPEELKQMVLSIRNIEQSMGSFVKKVSDSERKNMLIARKGIVANVEIKKGDILTKENLHIKRTGSESISPMRWYEVIGKTAIKDFNEDDTISI